MRCNITTDPGCFFIVIKLIKCSCIRFLNHLPFFPMSLGHMQQFNLCTPDFPDLPFLSLLFLINLPKVFFVLLAILIFCFSRNQTSVSVRRTEIHIFSYDSDFLQLFTLSHSILFVHNGAFSIIPD